MVNLFRVNGRLIVLAMAAMLLLTAAACTATVTTGTPVAVPTIVVTVSPATTPTSPVPPAGAPAGMTEIKATLTNGKVTLDKSTVSPGPIRFTVKNDGSIVHALEVVGQGIDQRTNDLNQGEMATLDVTLTAGDYEVYCPVSGHRERGMTTTLMVR